MYHIYKMLFTTYMHTSQYFVCISPDLTSQQNLWNSQPNSIIIHSITMLYKYSALKNLFYIGKSNCTKISDVQTQNSGGEKLWYINNFKVLARKTLANVRYL